MIPDAAQAHRLHAKAGSNQRIITHCELVAKIAEILASSLEEKGIPVDKKSVYAAAMLHDIGRTKTNTVDHGHVGAEMVRSYGVDESVARIINCHVGAGISPEEAQKFRFPEGDYIPSSLEERIVCFSDKIVENDRLAPFEQEVEKFRKKGLDFERLISLKMSLQQVLGEDPERVVLERLT